MGPTQLSDVEKARILALREENVPVSAIMRRTGRGRSTIQRLCKEARDLPPTVVPQYKKLPRLKRKTSQLTDKLLKLAVTRNPRFTAKELKSMYSELLKDVAIRKVEHRLRHHLGLLSRVVTLKPLLTGKMRRKRLTFAKQHKNWSVEQWKGVLWSDESNFRVVTSHRLRVRRPLKRNRYDPRHNKLLLLTHVSFPGVRPARVQETVSPIPARNYKLPTRNRKKLKDGIEELTLDDVRPARVQETVSPIPARNYNLPTRNRKKLKDGIEELTLDDDACPAVVPSGASQSQKPPGQTPYTISVMLTRGNEGFGFSVAWTKPPRVERVEGGMPAERAGLRAGDYIIFVSHYNVVKSSEDDVLHIIRECGNVLPLEVYRRGVSKHPRGLVNGFTASAAAPPRHLLSVNDNEAHPRKKLNHISFSTENAEDRQTLVFAVITCEQAFSNLCRFGVERYLIPLTFRGDLITTTQHAALFNNLDQLMDMSESLVDSLMGNSEEAIGERVGTAYYQMVDELVQQYTEYLAGLPDGDQVLALKLQEQEFNEFLHEPPVSRKKPDLTSFIHKPAEHLRELLGLLTQVYAASGGHPDNAQLDAVLDRLKSCYRGVTSQQNIMEPSPPAPLPPPTAHHTPPPTTARPPAPFRPPLISVADIEQRLVFTKFTQPFPLNDGKRQWVFGGELYKFEGRHLKQYWAMLFTDLLLFTKINRDRVIFVMEDPVPLASVCQAIFNVKKKVTEFRMIVDVGVRVPGSESGYLSSPSSARRRRGSTTSTASSGRANKRTLVIRAPTVDLKATWNNLINRQLYECQLGGCSPLADYSASSLARAFSSEGLSVTSPPSHSLYFHRNIRSIFIVTFDLFSS
ncbi:Regulator of G-protein signaling 12 [Chionoecetes opilio]|uniref:Regulator of G-protein signaling 12 n=1 Tax=Chionoecetes opilio TaxID=41210 RepID=A0A8J4XWK0_CHIOP|nr:Regulator of G-protein signaling 12 [Chionoecetes opilio]